MVDLAFLSLVIAAFTFVVGGPIALLLPAVLPAVLASPAVETPVARVDVARGWSASSPLDALACATSPSAVYPRFRARTSRAMTTATEDTCATAPTPTDRHGRQLTGAAAKARARKLSRTDSHREVMRGPSCEGNVRK